MSFKRVEDYFTWDGSKFQVNYWRRETLPTWLGFATTDVPNGLLTIPAAGAGEALVTFKQPYFSVEGGDAGFGTPFEARSLIFEDSTDGTPAANFTVTLFEAGTATTFQNNPIHVRTMFGTAQFPAILREPYFMPSQHQLFARFNKIAGGATTIRAYLHGKQYFPWAPEFLRRPQQKEMMLDLLRKWNERRRYVNPYWLTTEITPVVVPANGAAEATMKVGTDGPVEAFGHAIVSTSQALQWSIQDPKKYQTLQNGQVTSINAGGEMTLPTLYPRPFLIPPGKRIRLVFNDTSGAQNTVFFTLFGRKIRAPMKNVQEVLDSLPGVPTPADSPTPLIPPPLVSS